MFKNNQTDNKQEETKTQDIKNKYYQGKHLNKKLYKICFITVILFIVYNIFKAPTPSPTPQKESKSTTEETTVKENPFNKTYKEVKDIELKDNYQNNSQQMEFGRAKSAIFFPLYIDNVYIGYWIIESGTPHDFDNVDTAVLEVIKDNIVSVLKTVVHQKTLESIVRKDLFTGLNSEEYLYGEGKRIIDQHTTSTICMFRIANLEEINKIYSRELGNEVVTQVSAYIQKNIASDYVFVRYMGPKFVIAFSGVEISGVADFLNDLKNSLEKMKIALPNQEDEETKNNKEKIEVTPRLNFAISTYYKGTGLEEVLKKLEEYIDNASKNESDITKI